MNKHRKLELESCTKEPSPNPRFTPVEHWLWWRKIGCFLEIVGFPFWKVFLFCLSPFLYETSILEGAKGRKSSQSAQVGLKCGWTAFFLDLVGYLLKLDIFCFTSPPSAYKSSRGVHHPCFPVQLSSLQSKTAIVEIRFSDIPGL